MSLQKRCGRLFVNRKGEKKVSNAHFFSFRFFSFFFSCRRTVCIPAIRGDADRYACRDPTFCFRFQSHSQPLSILPGQHDGRRLGGPSPRHPNVPGRIGGRRSRRVLSRMSHTCSWAGTLATLEDVFDVSSVSVVSVYPGRSQIALHRRRFAHGQRLAAVRSQTVSPKPFPLLTRRQ